MLFTTALDMLAAITNPVHKGKLAVFAVFAVPRLLLIDDIGYLPNMRQGVDMFFELNSRRFARGTTVLTTNQSLRA